MVVWLIGLSGAGKTTIGEELAAQWRQHEPNTVLLDGDRVREMLGPDPRYDPYSVAGRRINAERMTGLCEMLDAQGDNVVCCILSIFPEMREANRGRFSRYFEVYLSTSLETCVARDQKNLYAPAYLGRRKNVVGVDIDFQPPSHPDLTLDNGASGARPDALAREILHSIRGEHVMAAR